MKESELETEKTKNPKGLEAQHRVEEPKLSRRRMSPRERERRLPRRTGGRETEKARPARMWSLTKRERASVEWFL